MYMFIMKDAFHLKNIPFGPLCLNSACKSHYNLYVYSHLKGVLDNIEH